MPSEWTPKPQARGGWGRPSTAGNRREEPTPNKLMTPMGDSRKSVAGGFSAHKPRATGKVKEGGFSFFVFLFGGFPRVEYVRES